VGKRHVALKIKSANPVLYRDDPGIADIIAMCLSQDGSGAACQSFAPEHRYLLAGDCTKGGAE